MDDMTLTRRAMIAITVTVNTWRHVTETGRENANVDGPPNAAGSLMAIDDSALGERCLRERSR